MENPPLDEEERRVVDEVLDSLPFNPTIGVLGIAPAVIIQSLGTSRMLNCPVHTPCRIDAIFADCEIDNALLITGQWLPFLRHGGFLVLFNYSKGRDRMDVLMDRYALEEIEQQNRILVTSRGPFPYKRVFIFGPFENANLPDGGQAFAASRYGRPILERVLRQVRRRSLEPRVVTDCERIKKLAELSMAVSSERWAHIIDETRYLWGRRNMFLLGYVLYSEDAIDSIFEDEHPIAVLKDIHGAITGVSFSDQNRLQSIINTLQENSFYMDFDLKSIPVITGKSETHESAARLIHLLPGYERNG